MLYDNENIFAKILRNEIPHKCVYEDNYALAFEDINPQAPNHVLVIPKGKYISFDDFTNLASDMEITGFFRAVGTTARKLKIDKQGYRVLSNIGKHGGQEVPHFHIHLFGGRRLGSMIVSE
ncbi:MAG: histidine triad nucleotide-binding protein [Rhodospirillaceae bacterium]|nr:histidine triad nucleotide-binding protein [Rhodospirillaceae bacterium]